MDSHIKVMELVICEALLSIIRPSHHNGLWIFLLSLSLSLYIWMEFCREKKQETGVGTSVMGHDQSLPYRQEAGKGMQLKLSSYIMFNDLLKSSKASQVNFYLIPWTL